MKKKYKLRNLSIALLPFSGPLVCRKRGILNSDLILTHIGLNILIFFSMNKCKSGLYSFDSNVHEKVCVMSTGDT